MDAAAFFADLLTFDTVAEGRFTAHSIDGGRPRVFGGQVLAQALVAAGRTVPATTEPHSLHAYFVGQGDPREPLEYEVVPMRDGRSFSSRQVRATQGGRLVFELMASFQVPEDGPHHAWPAPDVPGPDGLPPGADETQIEPLYGASMDRDASRAMGIEFRVAEPVALDGTPVAVPDATVPIWLRVPAALPDDPVLHCALLAYASDMVLMAAVGAPHGLSLGSGRLQTASVDHVMWFHQRLRVDDWLLLHQWSPFAGGARGLAAGRVFDRQGALVASTAQEALVRPVG